MLALHGTHGAGVTPWVAGGLLVAAGVAVIVWPDITLWAIAVLAGLGLVFAGAVELVLALADRDGADMPLRLALGGLTVVLGVLVVAWPGATLVVLAVILGIRAIGSGLVAIGLGWQLRRLATV